MSTIGFALSLYYNKKQWGTRVWLYILVFSYETITIKVKIYKKFIRLSVAVP